jgi:hypothetical protein
VVGSACPYRAKDTCESSRVKNRCGGAPTLSSQHLGVARGQYKAHVTTLMQKSSPQHMASSRMRRSVSSGSQSSWSIRILVRRVTVVLPSPQ